MDLREIIIRTVAYFDLFDHPLARAEILAYLSVPAAPPDPKKFNAALDALLAAGQLKEADGFIFIADRGPDLIELRQARAGYSARKWRRARRWARFFAALPGVELAGIGNTLAYNNAKDGSDIDFFIITAPGAIWRSRFFCAAAAAVFDLRPRPGDNRDKLCLSFFVTDDALDLAKLKFGSQDVYMDYWIRQMTPLAGDRRAAARFRAANPGAVAPDPAGGSKLWKAVLFPLGLLPGALARGWQQRHFPPVLRQAAAKGDGSVVISDDVLKFHVSDRRRDIYERWVKRVNSILNETR